VITATDSPPFPLEQVAEFVIIYILSATGASPLPRRSTLLKKQGTTARLPWGSGDALEV
jgi:hypothetical protein